MQFQAIVGKQLLTIIFCPTLYIEANAYTDVP